MLGPGARKPCRETAGESHKLCQFASFPKSGYGGKEMPVKKLVFVLATFLYTPAHADTVTIGWWDKSIRGSVATLSASLARHSDQPNRRYYSASAAAWQRIGLRSYCRHGHSAESTLVVQDNFHDVLRVDLVTLTGFAPGQPFSITEVFEKSWPLHSYSYSGRPAPRSLLP